MWKVYFNLNKPSQLEASSEINEMKLSVTKGSDQLVVEFANAGDEADANQRALVAANQFLDFLCPKYNSAFEIDPNSQHVENIDPTGPKHIYISAHASVGITSQVTAVKKASSGHVIEVYDSSKPGRIETKPSEAASYYRHAHLTDDPFNRFHDLYLAAENVASKIEKAKRLGKSEIKQLSQSKQSFEEGLLKLALDECSGSDPPSLKQVAKNLPDFDDAQETIPQVAKILYNGYRCQLNHSKAAENKKIPFNPQDEKEVKAALPLMEFVAKSLLQYEEASLP